MPINRAVAMSHPTPESAKGHQERRGSNRPLSMRVLLVSRVRPSRSLRLARRILRDVPGVQICGIAQYPLSELPGVEQAIANGKTVSAGHSRGFLPKIEQYFASCFEHVLNGFLWFIHGCPRLHAQKTLTATRLGEHCSKTGWAFLQLNGRADEPLSTFIRRENPEVIVELGDGALLEKCDYGAGWLKVRTEDVGKGVDNSVEAVRITVEHGHGSSPSSESLGAVTLPRQRYDTPVGFALKTDLVSDDLLVQSLIGLHLGSPEGASRHVTKWVEEMLAPYFAQFTGSESVAGPEPHRQWYRSVWSLCFDTMVLCSPLVIGRNWVRRLRGRYPVLILTHHLVSDRKHRMGMSTAAFWRQVRFLLRHYQVVGLSDAVSILESKRTASPTVSLTFDDGYADNFISLRAVAEEAGISVTLFITTEPVKAHSEFQHDVVKGNRGAFPMTWSQIRYWQSQGAEFGSHTRTHVKCGLADGVRLQDEIMGSKSDLERELGTACRFFAFPYGDRGNMPRRAVQIAANGYDHFLSSYGGENRIGGGDRAHLFRKNAFAEPWELELELQSVFDFVETIKRFFHPVLRRRVLSSTGTVGVSPVPQQDTSSLVSSNQIN